MYSIGEFSRITGLSIKALRLYHEKGLLVPSIIDQETGYRYYDHDNVERARIITHLRDMDFSLSDIGGMLKAAKDDADVLGFFEEQMEAILEKIRRQKDIVRRLEDIIKREKEAITMMESVDFEVEEKELEPILIAGIRFKGRYSDCGQMFAKIAKRFGREICGPAFSLYYDPEYKEEDADIESCMPIRKGQSGDNITVREFPGGRCVSLVHKGPYETLGRSYEKIMAYIKKKGYEPKLPSREVYLKGPGMVFKGNPENYLTEIQILI